MKPNTKLILINRQIIDSNDTELIFLGNVFNSNLVDEKKIIIKKKEFTKDNQLSAQMKISIHVRVLRGVFHITLE